MNASLNEKLRAVKWGEYRIVDIFDVKNTQSILSRDLVLDSGKTPYLCASSVNNAVSSYVSYDERYIDKGNCVFIGGKTFVVSYQEENFFSNDSHNLALYLKDSKRRTKSIQLFLTACITMSLKHKYSWGNSISNKKIQDDTVLLPVKNDKIDFEFMESFIAELEAQHIAELEAYLKATGLNNYILTDEEQKVLVDFESWEWKLFNLEKLFGKSTRGKRLKSADRIEGVLPFVTAGEADEGISAYIGNDVEVFEANTTTIDMFGSAKYRNYQYGADDHVAVVHTEKLSKLASIFTTTAIHKSAHSGKFSYSRNFYAKDADALDILLPVIDGKPNYKGMSLFISAVQKTVIRDVVFYSDQKIKATKKTIGTKDNEVQ